MRPVFKNISAFAVMCSTVLFVSCADKKDNEEGGNKDEHTIHWGYETDDGPAKWGTMDAEWILCAEGLEQSPIDLAHAAETVLPGIEFNLLSVMEAEVLNQAGVISELDNGHTIQVNAKTGESLTVGGKTYALLQFHFHAPSEHTVNGEHYPMEMHFVHQAESGALAVVGVFVEEGDHNPAIEPIWANFGNEPGKEAAVEIPIDFNEYVFAWEGAGLYHYDGSLTTPPCSEGVKWYIRKTPAQFSKEQIEEFKTKYDHNNRPVQALNKRALYIDENPSITVN